LDLKAGLTKEDLAPHLAKIQKYVLQNASFSSKEGGDYQIRFTEPDILRAEVFGDFVLLKFELEGVKNVPEKINVQYEAFIKDISGHTALLVIEENKKVGLLTTNQCIRLSFRVVKLNKNYRQPKIFCCVHFW
jgi:hypothetical protein